MYDECGDTLTGGRYNCKYEGKAKVLPQTSDSLMRESCPHLFKNSPYNDNQTYTCCNPIQLERLNDGFSIPRQLTSHCPACFLNLRTFLCDLVCNPDQSDYLIVTAQQPYIPKPVTTTPIDDFESFSFDTKQLNDNSSTNSSNQIEKADVLRLSYYLTSHYVNKLYKSCK